jgi:hypothetical protein
MDMGKVMRWIRPIAVWLVAALLAAVLGSLLQTQINLYDLQRLGADIGWSERWATSGQDLLGFGPAWFGLVAIGFAIALPVAAWIVHRYGRRAFWFTLAGACAVAAILTSMSLLLGIMPIAAAREWPGFGGMLLTGAAGGCFGGWLLARRRP